MRGRFYNLRTGGLHDGCHACVDVGNAVNMYFLQRSQLNLPPFPALGGVCGWRALSESAGGGGGGGKSCRHEAKIRTEGAHNPHNSRTR